jgi:hypothetical protein
MTESVPTRREAQRLTPEILGHYHDMLMANDLESFKKLLDVYRVPEEAREELQKDFTRYAEEILRRKWHGSKWF